LNVATPSQQFPVRPELDAIPMPPYGRAYCKGGAERS
jgi:hypothetical protein